ncbi:MAG: aminopeptidase P family protein [Deltaproteobacteria bacterium]|nr:aminopeptidase P family protein [Deltaproteobacteria bacterium]MBW2250523.1 aminopeptidase P family protein [Deltaproteobacteria bacterium]MBW2565147.1 aminopeptidase P family protein [Deltaproteobacteria bacterium]
MYNIDLNTPKSELERRIKKLQKKLDENNIDGTLILQKADLFYFSGTIQDAHLYVPCDNDPILMVYKDLERASAESSIKNIVPLKNIDQICSLLHDNGYTLPRILGMELDVLPANLYFNYKSLFEHTKLIDISHYIRLIRAVKSTYEIDMIRKAAHLSDKVADCVKEFLHEGITEIELAGKIEARARKLGHPGIVRMRLWGSELFYGHLLSGPSAAVPSYLSSPTGGTGVSPSVAQSSGLRPIQRGEPVLVDYVFVLNGYMSDHARIFALGNLPDDLIRAHEAMLKVQTVIKKEAKPKVKAGILYDMALELTKELGYEEYFMGVGDRRIRFVGHGLGIELDEYPFLAKGQELELEKGMTIALEPKLIFPGKGVVGIENTHIVTDEGLKQLTHFDEKIFILYQ